MRVVLAILLLSQSPATAPVVAVPTLDPSRFDITTVRPREPGCGDVPVGDEVVVCARMTDLLPGLEEQAAKFELQPFKPRWRMLGGEGGVVAEQRSTIMGSAPAAMATFKLKF